MIVVNLISLLITVGVAYTMIGGLNPVIDALINDVVLSLFPNLDTEQPLAYAALNSLTIVIFMLPVFFLIRLAIRKVVKREE